MTKEEALAQKDILDKIKAEIESYKLSEDELPGMDEDSVKWGMKIACDIVDTALIKQTYMCIDIIRRELEYERATLINREKFREIFGVDINTVGSMCHSNGFCDPFCDNHCQW